MKKKYFHNYKSVNENNRIKKSAPTSKVGIKSVVDINILLNRVRIEEKNDMKRRVILFSFIVLAISLLGIFITTIK
tara:strand:+ start:50 stop:277 length:228 start_codon:yes stop_codon:yes gene_type:complete